MSTEVWRQKAWIYPNGEALSAEGLDVTRAPQRWETVNPAREKARAEILRSAHEVKLRGELRPALAALIAEALGEDAGGVRWIKLGGAAPATYRIECEGVDAIPMIFHECALSEVGLAVSDGVGQCEMTWVPRKVEQTALAATTRVLPSPTMPTKCWAYVRIGEQLLTAYSASLTIKRPALAAQFNEAGFAERWAMGGAEIIGRLTLRTTKAGAMMAGTFEGALEVELGYLNVRLPLAAYSITSRQLIADALYEHTIEFIGLQTRPLFAALEPEPALALEPHGFWRAKAAESAARLPDLASRWHDMIAPSAVETPILETFGEAQVIRLDGTDDNLRITNWPSFPAIYPFTFAVRVWVIEDLTVISMGNSNVAGQCAFEVYVVAGRVYLLKSQGGAVNVATPAGPDWRNRWITIVGRITATHLKLTVNGNHYSTTHVTTTGENLQPIALGWRPSGNFTAPARYRWAALWEGRELSDAEIARLGVTPDSGADVLVTSAPWAWWRAGDQRDAATVTDKSGNGRNLAQGTAGLRPVRAITAGVEAFSFDGVDDRVPLAESTPTFDKFTIMMVFRVSSAQSSYRGFMQAYAGVSGWYLAMHASLIKFGMGLVGELSHTRVITDSKWYGAIVRMDGATLRLELVGFGAVSVARSSSPASNLMLGGDGAVTLPIAAQIAEAAIWDRSLTDGEAEALGYRLRRAYPLATA